jgi:hypothetical protein
VSAKPVLWQRLDTPRHEAARVCLNDSRWQLAGRAVFAHASQPRWRRGLRNVPRCRTPTQDDAGPAPPKEKASTFVNFCNGPGHGLQLVWARRVGHERREKGCFYGVRAHTDTAARPRLAAGRHIPSRPGVCSNILNRHRSCAAFSPPGDSARTKRVNRSVHPHETQNSSVAHSQRWFCLGPFRRV